MKGIWNQFCPWKKADIKIELPDGTVINGQDEHSKVLESFFALIM